MRRAWLVGQLALLLLFLVKCVQNDGVVTKSDAANSDGRSACSWDSLRCKADEQKGTACCLIDEFDPLVTTCCGGIIHFLLVVSCNSTTGRCYQFCDDCIPPEWRSPVPDAGWLPPDGN